MTVYRYKRVEQALASLQGIPPAAIGAFRGRLVHFQRVGISPEAPGRGKKIDYQFKDVCVWAVALQLAEYGIDPTRISAILTWVWPQIETAVLEESKGEDNVFVGVPAILTREIIDRVEGKNPSQGGVFPVDSPSMTMVRKASKVDASAPRLITINLSDLRRRVLVALADTE